MAEEKIKTNLFVVTDKYGTTESKLKPGFTENVRTIEKEYKIENIPQEVLDVCKEIEKLAGRALLVGGCVRDCVISQEHPGMNLKPKDFDLEIYGMTPETLQLLLEKTFGADKVDSVGREFGILKVQIAGWDEPLDFSIPRTENKTGVGHTGFTVVGHPEMSLIEAAKRRDITVNSMAYDPLTEIIYDPFDGIKDIKEKIIRFTDAITFQEDPLRVIRIMQFAARFGFSVDPETEELCRQMVARGDVDLKKHRADDNKDNHFVPGEIEEDIKDRKGFMVVSGGETVYLKPYEKPEKPGLAKERIAEEIYKLLLKGKTPSLGFEFARRIGLVKVLWPDLEAMFGVEQEHSWHPEGDVWTHSLQTMDVMVEIADREIREGKIPTPDMLKILEERLKGFESKKTEDLILLNYKEKIVLALGEDEWGIILDQAREYAENIDQAFMTKMLDLTHVTAHARAKNEINGMLGERAYKIRKALENGVELSAEEMETVPDEERLRRIEERAKGILSQMLAQEKPKWLVAGKTDFVSNELRELERLIKEKTQKMIQDGKLSQESLLEIEESTKLEATNLTDTERKKRLINLKNDIKVVLVMTALGHDLGKVTTTKFEEGRIRSKGHELAGVEPMKRILDTLATTRFSTEMRAMTLPLIAEHLKPFAIYLETNKFHSEESLDEKSETTIEEVTDPNDKKQLERRLRRLQNRLNEANLYLLGLIAEADQRGRDPSGTPSSKEKMGSNLDWQNWWNEKISELDLVKPREKIITGGQVLDTLKMKKADSGAWIRVIINCVERDFEDGMIQPENDPLQSAEDYYNRFVIYIRAKIQMELRVSYDTLPEKDKKNYERDQWEKLIEIDARSLITPGKKQ